MFQDSYRGAGIAIGGYSRDDPAALAHRNPDAALVNVVRTRQIAREYHDWALDSEAEIEAAAVDGG